MGLPTGNVTFLFTDIEGSTKLVERVGDAYAGLLAAHHGVIREAIRANGGIDLRTEGDSFFAVFASPSDAVTAAIQAQHGISADPQLAANGVKVRMGLHAGEGQLGGDNYVGIDVHLAARIQSAAHGGQILVSDTVAADLPNGVEAIDLGSFWLKDIAAPTRIHQLAADGLDRDFEPVNAAPTHPVNAPRDLSSFLGREDEIHAALNLLTSNRLVTLTGPGGTGKTRLAIEIGTLASRTFTDGVVFVPLAGIEDPELVPNAIIDAADIRNTDSAVPPIDVVIRYLGDSRSLLIVDNMEHVLDACGYIQKILDKASNTSVLATSRTPLRVSGERELAIRPLDVSTTALNLFADRASAVNAAFELDETNHADVAEIVRRVDGLPLAVELAAARTRMMSPASILATLDPLSLGDRELSLNDTIQWSFDLLSEPEQQLLVRMGVFPTGSGFDQINAVCQPGTDLGLDLINGIGALVEHSLLIGDETTGTPRFRMLETIREFAVRGLAASPDEALIRQRHLEAYTALAEAARPHLDAADSATWLAMLTTENANLQAAFAYAIETSNAEYAQRIVAAVWRFWQMRGHLAEGTVAAAEALALAGSPVEVRAVALDAAGSIAYWAGDRSATRSYYEEAVAIRRQHDHTEGLANALYNLSFPVADDEGLEACTALLDEAAALAQDEGDESMLVRVYMSLSRAWIRTAPDKALEFAETAAEYADRVDDPVLRGWAHGLRANAMQFRGDYVGAFTILQTTLEIFRDLDDLSGITVNLAGLANMADELGEDAIALYIVGAVWKLREDTGIGIDTASDGTIQKYATPESVDALPADLRERYDAGHADPLATAIETALAWDVG